MTQHAVVDESFVLPASFGQERLWLLDRLGTGSAYHMSGALRLTGALDADALAIAVAGLVDRHEVLRTTFEFGPDGTLAEVVHSAGDVRVHHVDIASGEDREAAARQELADFSEAPFDLATGPLLRVALARVADDTWLLVVAMHHIVSDGWSVGVLLSELAELYRAATTGRPAALPELAIQYGDFAAWQRERVESASADGIDYWRATLAGAQPVQPAAGAAAPAPRNAPWTAGAFDVVLPPHVGAAIHRLGRQEAVSPFMVLLAAFAATLARWTEQPDVVIGTPVAGRDRAELQGLIGFFVNTLPIRVGVRHDEPFRVLLHAVREACLGAYAHQDVPFERIVDASRTDRSGTGPPLVGALLALQNTPATPWNVPGLAAEPVELPVRHAQLPLSLHLVEDGHGGFTGQLVHAREVWESRDAAALGAAYGALLDAATREPDRLVGRLSLGSWPAPAVTPAVADECVHTRIARVAREHPDRVALVAGSERITYRALDERAGTWARRLRLAGAGPDKVVAVCVPRSAAQVVAFLAVLKSGAAYLPLDPAHPVERLRRLIGEARPAAVLCDSAVAASDVLDSWTGPGAPTVLTIDADQWRPREVPVSSDEATNNRTLAYVLHTSGSTGTPKGAMNEHAALANRIAWMQATFPLAPDEAVVYKTPSTFDVSSWEWIWPLTVGARVVVADANGHHDPAYLARLMVEEAVTTCHFVPSMLSAFLDDPEARRCDGSLRRILCSGEELPTALARRALAVLPNVELANLYGPAEAAIDVTCRLVEPGDLERRRIPIGNALPGVRLGIVDAQGEPVPPGVPGELRIGGVAVGRGYLGRPGRTAERFVPDPYAADGSRWYRTGDRVRQLPDGAIDFLGRYDHQVKVRGIRVEPGEIEAALAEHPEVRSCVVVAAGTVEDRRLVAYVACPSAQPTTSTLRAFLARRLPAALIPDTFVVLTELPLNHNGKLDRGQLPEPAMPDAPPQSAIPPRTAVEHLLAGIWADVLGTTGFGVTDNFYEIGGNSLRAVAVFHRAQQEGLLLPLQHMLGDHSIEQLAGRVGDDPQETLREIGKLLA